MLKIKAVIKFVYKFSINKPFIYILIFILILPIYVMLYAELKNFYLGNNLENVIIIKIVFWSLFIASALFMQYLLMLFLLSIYCSLKKIVIFFSIK